MLFKANCLPEYKKFLHYHTVASFYKTTHYFYSSELSENISDQENEITNISRCLEFFFNQENELTSNCEWKKE